MSPVVRLALPYSTISHMQQDFRKRELKIKCVLLISLKLLSETFLILRRIHRTSCKALFFFF
jgi:hypothetical protein